MGTFPPDKQGWLTSMTLHDLITLMILPIRIPGTNEIQYMKYTSEYILKLQIHQHLFGVQDEIRVHQLENELFSLSPISFDYNEGFFTKFKSLVLFFKKCGIDKKEYQLILSILSKLGPKYSVFVSTFHATRLSISNRKMPYLSTLFDSLTKK